MTTSNIAAALPADSVVADDRDSFIKSAVVVRPETPWRATNGRYWSNETIHRMIVTGSAQILRVGGLPKFPDEAAARGTGIDMGALADLMAGLDRDGIIGLAETLAIDVVRCRRQALQTVAHDQDTTATTAAPLAAWIAHQRQQAAGDGSA